MPNSDKLTEGDDMPTQPGESVAEQLRRQGERAAVRAMQKLAGRLAGEGPGRWTFDGHRIEDDVAEPLLSLTDHLNHLDTER